MLALGRALQLDSLPDMNRLFHPSHVHLQLGLAAVDCARSQSSPASALPGWTKVPARSSRGGQSAVSCTHLMTYLAAICTVHTKELDLRIWLVEFPLALFLLLIVRSFSLWSACGADHAPLRPAAALPVQQQCARLSAARPAAAAVSAPVRVITMRRVDHGRTPGAGDTQHSSPPHPTAVRYSLRRSQQPASAAHHQHTNRHAPPPPCRTRSSHRSHRSHTAGHGRGRCQPPTRLQHWTSAADIPLAGCFCLSFFRSTAWAARSRLQRATLAGFRARRRVRVEDGPPPQARTQTAGESGQAAVQSGADPRRRLCSEGDGSAYTLHESRAIARYLNDSRSGHLVPSTAAARGLLEHWTSIEQSHHTPAIGGVVYQRVVRPRFGAKTDEEAARKKAAEAQIPFAVMEAHLAQHPYLAGTRRYGGGQAALPAVSKCRQLMVAAHQRETGLEEDRRHRRVLTPVHDQVSPRESRSHFPHAN
jgi:hypothetical protein